MYISLAFINPHNSTIHQIIINNPTKHSINDNTTRYKCSLTNLADDFSSFIAKFIFFLLQINRMKIITPINMNVTAIIVYKDCSLSDSPKYSVSVEACNEFV